MAQMINAVGLESETEVLCSLSTRKSDNLFQASMALAIEAGLERAPIGIYKTNANSSFSPRHFVPAQRASGCSSPAGLCADAGEFHTGPFVAQAKSGKSGK